MSKYPDIPGHKIVKKLGEGGMATVYYGIQEKLNRKVAIKILEPSLLKNTVIASRFLIEAETAANLYHSNIISIYDIGHTKEHQYIIMEYLEETLKDYMLGHPGFRLKPEEALRILRPIAEALDYAHEKGIIHRDIKADNIMFREDRTPVLMDFGIARALDSDSQMTRTGISLGTPYYMSPEQCQADKLDGRSDFYSLGVVFYESIMGEKPYDADNPMAVALKHVQDPVPQLPEEFSRYQLLMDKLMAKAREDRVANGAELIKMMDSLEFGEQSEDEFFDSVFEGEGEPAAEALPESPEQLVFPEEEVFEDIDGEPEPLEQQIFPEEDEEPVQDTAPMDHTVIESEPVERTEVPGEERDGDDDDLDFMDKSIFDPDPKSDMDKGKKEKISLKMVVSPKLIIESIILTLLLIVIFVIFFNLGQGTQPGTNLEDGEGSKTQTASQTDPSTLGQGLQLGEGIALATKYFEEGSYEKARELLEELKKSNPGGTPELKELEEKLLGEGAFEGYFQSARDYFSRKNYKKARENVLRAKEIRSTPELEDLQKRIDGIIARSARIRQQKAAEGKRVRQLDDQAYSVAKAGDTVEAYRGYIDGHPSGRHIDEAMARINRLKEIERQRKEAARLAAIKVTVLRSGYRTLDYTLAESMIRKYTFFDNGFNKGGGFKNHFEKKSSSGSTVVIDRATGLMWYSGRLIKATGFRKADRWIRSLNRKKYGGYSDWRMPTLEEAASLLKKTANPEELHFPPVFPIRPKNAWTGDLLRLQTMWVVRFNSGTIFADSDRTKHQVVPVRKLD
ncbi:MAG: protein kinase [bacterium]|nr:protein kinase [bacterium]